MNKFMEQANLIKDDIVEFRRTIHKNPEVGDKLPKTKAYVMDNLKEFGYEPEEICESGIVATIKGNKPGKTFLLRADMDALPMAEATECDFKSNNGCMHSCGHDMHTAMLLGAAKLLRQNQDEIEGTIKLVFQPDEEGFTGAKKMLAAGVLENPKVDAAMAMHVHSSTPSNVVLCGLGTSIAGCNRFRIVVNGTGCHGAMPELGVDPINIAAHIYISLQEIIAREISATKPAVVTIGKFVGGEAPNIIPGEVVMEGTIRSLDKEVGEFIFDRMNEIVTSTAPPPAAAVNSFSSRAFWFSSIWRCIFCACFIRLFMFPGIPMPGNPPRFAITKSSFNCSDFMLDSAFLIFQTGSITFAAAKIIFHNNIHIFCKYY